MSSASDTGSAESPAKVGNSEEDSTQSDIPKKKKHRVTFADDVSGNKKALTEVHMIESYKKYNQEFYVETPGQGCCSIF